MARRKKHGLSDQEKKIFWRLVILAIILGVLYFLFAPGRGLLSYHSLRKEVGSLTRENQELEIRNRELAEEVDRLQSDDTYLETMAREKYGLLKKNETVYDFGPPAKKKKE